MDQLTHTVRRSNWINIIRQCQDRPAGTTAKQWLAENDISEKSYYYWLRKIRREVCEQEGLQEVTTPSALSFVEIPVKTALDTTPVPAVPAAMTPVAVIRSGPPDAGIIKRYFRVPALQAAAGGASCLKMLPVSAES